MYTVLDYIEYYKNNSFKEYTFNEMDALILSILTYLPFDKNIAKITLNRLNKSFVDYDTSGKGLMVKTALRLLREMQTSVRYANMEFYNIENIVNDKYQFGAFVTRLDGKKIVCYKGTDSSLIGWKEDFRLSFDYLTNTQKKAIDYLKKIPFSYEKDVILLGHSKGGNLAITSAINYHNIYNRVSKIYNFDGPGLPNEIINSKEWDQIKDKVVNFVPENSIVGMLLNNENYYPIKTDGVGLKCHYLPNWYCYGTYLLKGNLSKASIKLHNESNNRLLVVDKDELKEVIDSFFDVLDRQNIKTTKELRNLDMSEIKNIFKDIQNVSKETKDYFIDVLKTFFLTR